MAKSTSIDALMSMNAVSNLIPELSGSAKMAENVSGISFSKTLNDSAYKASSESVNVNEELKTGSTTVLNSKESSTNIKEPETKVSEKNVNKDSKEVKAEVKEAATEKGSEVAEKIEETFEVSEEELTEAMELLGFTLLDLLNPDNLKELVLKVTGNDEISLLTDVNLYESLNEVVSFVNEINLDLSEEFNIPMEELPELIEEVKNTDFSEVLENSIDKETVNYEKSPEVIISDERTEKTDYSEENKEVKVFDDKSSENNVSNDNVVSKETETVKKVSDNLEKNNSGNKENKNQQSENTLNMGVTETTTVVNNEGMVVTETVTSYSNTENVVRQVIDFVKVSLTDDVQNMEMQLHPASLGTVNMQVTSQNGVVTAHLTVSNEMVKGILESQLIKLQETFEAQGTKVSAIEVSVSANMNFNAENGNENQNNEAGRGTRRSINLNSLEELEDLTEEEELAAKVMEMNGSSVDYSA